MTVLDIRRLSMPSVDRRTLLGVALAATAAILIVAITRPPQTQPVLVANETVPAGVPLGEVDIGTRMVTDHEGLVIGSSLGELADWTVAVAITEGEPLTPSVLRPPIESAGDYEMALSLPAGHAVQGRIAVGDTVDVYATYDEPGEPSRTELIASDIAVVSTADAGDRAATVDLVISVDNDTAAALAGALHTAQLDLVRRPRP
ncbi:MAG: hypothetical protein HKO87_00430 [Acidimicrobiia bacterium]|nr:hypothetical protein [Acidimicrobiia bacterium]